MNLNLKAGHALPVTIAGSWVYLETADKHIVLESEQGNRVTLKQDAVIKNHEQIGRVLVYSDIDQDVSIEFGFGDFTPPSNINGQSVVITELPKVEISAGQSINIEQMPAMQMAAGQSVNIGQMPAVQIANLPNIQFANGQTVGVSQLPAVEIAQGQEVTTRIGNSLNAQESVMPLTIASNDNRRKLRIKASAANTQEIVIAGAYPLSAGESIELETTASIELTGDAADTAHVLEY